MRDSLGEADQGHITENLPLRDLDITLKVIVTILKQASIQCQLQDFCMRSLGGKWSRTCLETEFDRQNSALRTLFLFIDE